MAKKNETDNKYEMIVETVKVSLKSVMKNYKKVILILMVAGVVIFVCQIKKITIGNTVIEREPMKTEVKVGK